MVAGNSLPNPHYVHHTTYTSGPVDIPPDFLTSPITPAPSIEHVNWKAGSLPHYDGYYATVLDGVLSPQECQTLLDLAVQSSTSKENGGWQAALVNAGIGREVLDRDYRNSDRIIWDSQTIADRLWQRCLQAPGLSDDLERISNHPHILSSRAIACGESWRFFKVNERLRFLKYGPGQFFAKHCDGRYISPTGESSFYTIHLYLNDSEEHGGSLEGGATTFHGRRGKQLDVNPKAGRVLIFQHNGLVHSGAEVTAGVKFTVRTDIMYQRM